MKARLFLRVGRRRASQPPLVAASVKPNPRALTDSSGSPVPTVQMELEVEVPDAVFVRAAKALVTLREEDTEVVADVKVVDK